MSDFQDTSELSAAQRPMPAWVLWVMAAVVVAGSATLVWSEPAAKASPASPSFAKLPRYAAAPTAHQSATSKQAPP